MPLEMCGSLMKLSPTATVKARSEVLSTDSPVHTLLLFGHRLPIGAEWMSPTAFATGPTQSERHSDILYCYDEKNSNPEAGCLPLGCELLSCSQS